MTDLDLRDVKTLLYQQLTIIGNNQFSLGQLNVWCSRPVNHRFVDLLWICNFNHKLPTRSELILDSNELTTHTNTELNQTHNSHLLGWVNPNSQLTINELTCELKLSCPTLSIGHISITVRPQAICGLTNQQMYKQNSYSTITLINYLLCCFSCSCFNFS